MIKTHLFQKLMSYNSFVGVSGVSVSSVEIPATEDKIFEYADKWSSGDVKSLQTEVHPALKVDTVEDLRFDGDMSADKSLLEHSYSQPDENQKKSSELNESFFINSKICKIYKPHFSTKILQFVFSFH